MAGKSQLRMKVSISTDASVAEIVDQFLLDEGLAAGASESGGDGIRVAASAERRECTINTIWSGGWIRCAVAHAAARKLGISTAKMGRLLYALNVKIRQCELGCFK